MSEQATVDWLLVGTGDIVRKRVAAALTGAAGSRLVGICGEKSRATALAQQHGAGEVYDNLDEALAKTKASAVYIATSVRRHALEAKKAIAAGTHVLIEKPLSLHGGEARELARLAAASPRQRVGCAYYRRCSPRAAHARELMRSGALGPLVLVRMNCQSWFSPAADDPKLWRVSWAESGGGPMSDVGSHMLDMLIHLAGVPTVKSAFVGTTVQPYEVEDTAAALLMLPGAKGKIPGAPVQVNFGWNSKTFGHDMEIVGTEGRLVWSPFDSGPVKLTLGRETRELDLPPAANVHLPLIEDFVAAVREGRQPICPLDEAAKVDELMDAIYAAGGATGRAAGRAGGKAKP
ncbi:MAG: Gfo/Idh/MocA family oxidoreductase [Planctomycetota bacterium]|nr:Gfo/Idh/MocA family oxidoreductase [Planctomycetota bacterium]